MTFDPAHVLPWAWREVKGNAESVNEADYRCWNFLAAWSRGRLRGGCGFAANVLPRATGNEISCDVGGVVQWPLLNVCSVSPCVLIVGWIEGFRWPD